MSLDLAICASARVLASLKNASGHTLFVEKGRTPPPEGEGEPEAVPAPDAPAGSVRLSVATASADLTNLHTLSLPELAEAAVRAVTLGNITVLAIGSPALYPYDIYEFGLEGELAVNPAKGPPIPIQMRSLVLLGPALQPLRGGTLSFPTGTSKRFVGVQLRRPLGFKAYILLLATIPLVLALLIVIVISRRQPGQRVSVGAPELAGIGAVLLAILPIRQVLVPPGATQLTLVDYILGFEMALMVALACFAVSATMGRTAGVQDGEPEVRSATAGSRSQ